MWAQKVKVNVEASIVAYELVVPRCRVIKLFLFVFGMRED